MVAQASEHREQQRGDEGLGPVVVGEGQEVCEAAALRDVQAQSQGTLLERAGEGRERLREQSPASAPKRGTIFSVFSLLPTTEHRRDVEKHRVCFLRGIWHCSNRLLAHVSDGAPHGGQILLASFEQVRRYALEGLSGLDEEQRQAVFVAQSGLQQREQDAVQDLLACVRGTVPVFDKDVHGAFQVRLDHGRQLRGSRRDDLARGGGRLAPLPYTVQQLLVKSDRLCILLRGPRISRSRLATLRFGLGWSADQRVLRHTADERKQARVDERDGSVAAVGEELPQTLPHLTARS